MKKLDLCGSWQMRSGPGTQWLSCPVPGSAVGTLLSNGLMDDPYWRDNEFKIQNIFDEDYIFARSFTADADMLACRYVELCCEGLDTIAELTLNGVRIGVADNMHRTWRFDCKKAVQEGENRLEIRFRSPIGYLKEHPAAIGKRFTIIRKAACMYGWDWGLDLSDCGIWRAIRLEAYDHGRLTGNVIRQIHDEGTAMLHVTPSGTQLSEKCELSVTLLDPQGNAVGTKAVASGEEVSFAVEKPQLWWPVGYGEQPLYKLKTELLQNGTVCDSKEQYVGLRTVVLDRSGQPDGANYQFLVNGVSVFFRGENLIIADSILSRTNSPFWEKLIANCLKSNLNGIRVWGGAYYPPDELYDLCDRAGILIYQDFMFACSFYQVSEKFLENVTGELEDNLSRIAHHACLALLCGNNEIDGIYTVGGSTDPETAALRVLFGAGEDPLPESTRQYLWSQYKPLFLKRILEMCRKWAPDVSYVHSSPSLPEPGKAESFFDYLSGGDMHYYLQYNENAPYQKMRTLRCRFMTEIGFQSYPDWKTICSFTEPEDRLPYTPIMYAHQKCASGNEAIELYMERDYAVPKIFSDYVFLSQVQAGEIMRYTVEHFRRDNTYCRGIILWQLNDCWPVVSWSGIDYYGRWKALQYYIRRFYAPVLVSAEDSADSATLWLTNETPVECSGSLSWRLMVTSGAVLDAGKAEITAAAGESKCCVRLDYSNCITDENRSKVYLRWNFQNGENDQSGTVLFVLAKEFQFMKPNISCRVFPKEDGYAVEVFSDRFVKCIGLTTTMPSIGNTLVSEGLLEEGKRKVKPATHTIQAYIEALKWRSESWTIKMLTLLQPKQTRNSISKSRDLCPLPRPENGNWHRCKRFRTIMRSSSLLWIPVLHRTRMESRS